MKIINAHSELIDRPDNQLKLVERIGRTCYKSEDLITDDSYIKFCNGLATRKHYAMLEHAVFTFIIKSQAVGLELTNYKSDNVLGYKYFIIDRVPHNNYKDYYIVTANLRAIVESENYQLIRPLIQENPYLSDLFQSIGFDVSLFSKIDFEIFDFMEIVDNEYNTIKDKVKEIMGFYSSAYKDNLINQIATRHTFCTAYFQCDRGVTHEFVRHRPCSFAQSSTRYCNYSKGKFGNEITVIKPCFFSEENNDTNYWYWLDACKHAEQTYMWLINNGAKPEEARSVLPTSVAAELWITASLEEWQHIVNLRYLGTTGKPHPQMIEVIKPIAEQLSKYLNIDKIQEINE